MGASLGQPASVTRITLALHELAAEVLLGGQSVVRMTPQSEIGCVGGPTQGVRIHVVQLEKRRLATAGSAAVNVGAT